MKNNEQENFFNQEFTNNRATTVNQGTVNNRSTMVNQAPMNNRSTMVNQAPMNNRSTMVNQAPMNNRSTMVNQAPTNNRSTMVNQPNGGYVAPANDRSTTVNDGQPVDRGTMMHSNRASAVIPAGEVVQGYKILSVCGMVSGQSTVHIAEKDGRKYALKLYKDNDTCIDKTIVKLLKDKINCPSIIKVVDEGEYNGRYFTVTPYYEEGAVISHLDEIDPKLLKERYIPQLNEALNAIHEYGIFHCDIKPHNFYFANNRKDLVIGDFGIALSKNENVTKKSDLGIYIPKRELQKNVGTTAYLSMEGLEYAASWVDYYALGMSILNMAHGADVYEDVADNVIRDELVNNSVRIPDNVDPEVAALILKLLEGDNRRRIGYEGVKKWCKDNTYYGKYIKKENSRCRVQISRAVLNGLVFESTEEYVEYLLEQWEWGVEYYQADGILNDMARIADVDRAFVKELGKIKQDYKNKDANTGYLITLLKLNPEAPFCYKNERFGSFRGYVDYLDKNYKNLADAFFDEAAILSQLENEKLIKNSDGYDAIIEKVKLICACKEFTRENKMEMLRNYFSGKKDLVINGTLYPSVNDIAYLMFDAKLDPVDNKVIFNGVFLDYLSTVFSNVDEKKQELEAIWKIADKFNRNAQLSICLTGQIKYKYKNKIFGNMNDFISYAKDVYENQQDCKHFANLMRSGKLVKYYSNFRNSSAEFTDFLRGLNDDSCTDHELLTEFYNNTQKTTVFIYKGVRISNMGELFAYLGQANDLVRETNDLQTSIEFGMWLEGNGYREAVEAALEEGV